MRKLSWLMLVLALVGFGLLSTHSLAQEMSEVNRGPAEDDDPAGEFLSVEPQLPVGHVPRYRVAYMHSSTASPIRSATVISITNHSTVTCSTSVDWRFGLGGVFTTTTLSLGPGQTGEHCSRSLPIGITTCNATAAPALTATEGSAIVGSVSTPGCARIAVDARLFHTTGTTDDSVAAIADIKVVKPNAGNKGD